MGKRCLGCDEGVGAVSAGASRAPLSRAFMRARSTVPAPAAAQAVPNHQAASNARAPGAHAWAGAR